MAYLHAIRTGHRPIPQYAQTRRGLKLIEADARKLPFADNTHSTTIIATGVVDFMDDEGQIGLAVNEARRVTQGSGSVLVGFVRAHPAAERFARRIGVITDAGVLHQKKMYELTRLSPWEILKTLRKEHRMGMLRALREMLAFQMLLPRKEKKAAKRLAQMWKLADNSEALIDAAIESLPYRTEDDIRALFSRLQLSIDKLIVFDNCFVVQIGSKGEVGVGPSFTL